MEFDHARTIGDRLAWWRRQRGWTQRQLAGFAGVSAGFVGMIESGERALARRRDVYAFAEALQCIPEDLTGEPYAPSTAASAATHAALPALRAALLDSTLDVPPDVASRPVAELVREVDWIITQWNEGRFDSMARVLPAALDELHAHGATGDPAALSELVRALYAGQGLAKALGHPELACVAADRAHDAAVRHGDPALIGLSTWVQSLALERAGARRRAPIVAAAGLDVMEGHAGHGDVADEMYGMFHLACGLFAARAGNQADSDAHLDAAGEVAGRTGEADAFSLHFGPTNVAMWRMNAAAELGDGPRALELARAVVPALVRSPAREADFWAEMARAAAQDDTGAHDRQATGWLLRAEQRAAQKIHTDPLVRDVVRVMASRDRAGNADLRSFARRLSVA